MFYELRVSSTILVEGNLVKDPVERRTPQDTVICGFTIAVNRSYKKADDYVQEVSYFDVDVWSTLGENCLKHLCKGRGVRVVGRLKQERWLDDNEQNHSRVKIIAEHVEFKPMPQLKDNVHTSENEKIDTSVEELAV